LAGVTLVILPNTGAIILWIEILIAWISWRVMAPRRIVAPPMACGSRLENLKNLKRWMKISDRDSSDFWDVHQGSPEEVLVGALEHEFYDFPYIGNTHPN